MTEADILQQLTAIFRDVFDDDTITLTPATTADDVEGWDSAVHITITIAIEEHFHIKFRSAEIETLANVGDMIGLIRGKLSAGASGTGR